MELTTSPILGGNEVSALIPQKPPFEMVDKLWFSDESKTISGFTIPFNNILCENGLFAEPGLMENIAQTAALRVGYMASLSSENKIDQPPIGYIGAIKNLKIHKLPAVGSEIRTEVVVQQIIFDVTLITGRSTCNGELLAECEMKIFLKKE